MEKHDEVLVRLLQNTRRANVRRSTSITEIAADIELLSKHYGSTKKLADLLSITPGMLNKFLAVKKLCPQIQELVRLRKIDSVEAVANLTKYNPDEQIAIAKALQEKQITAHDLKFLRPLFLAHPKKSANSLVSMYADSKNKKVAVIKFDKSNLRSDIGQVRQNFLKIVGAENLLNVEMNNSSGSITLSKKGEMLLRKTAKSQKQTLQHLVSNLL